MKFILSLLLVFAFYFASSQDIQVRKGETEYALIEASRQKMLGNLEEAVKLYKMVVNDNPRTAAAWYELASIFSITGNLTEAETCIEKAYSLDNVNYWYVIAYADILRMSEKYKASLKILNKGMKKIPEEEITFRFNIAENLYLKKDFKKALKAYQKIETDYGITELTTIRIIDLFKNLGKHENVVQTYENILNLDPSNLPVYLMYAEYLSENGFHNKAIEIYEKALVIDDTDIFAISNLADLYGKTGNAEKSYAFLREAFLSDEISMEKKLQTLAFITNDEKRVLKEKDNIGVLIEALLDKDSENYELLIIAYDYYYKAGKHALSFDIIKRLVDLRNDNYIIWAQALYNANLLNEYDQVIELGARALKVFPNKDDLRVFIALAYYQQEKYNESYNMLKETGSLFTEDAMAQQKELLLAETAYKTGKISESFMLFQELILKEPDNSYVKNNYSYYLSLEGINLDTAKMYSYQTIMDEPENATFLDTYGWILYKRGEMEEAENYLRKAFQLDEGKSEEILNHFITILEENNKLEEIERIKKLVDDE